MGEISEFVGETEFHRYLWDANITYQAEFSRLNREMQDEENRYQLNRNLLIRERNDLERRRREGLQVEQDEFETSADFEERKRGLQRQFELSSERRLREIDQELEQLEADHQRRSARLENFLNRMGIQSPSRIVAENRIFIRAEMGEYDADRERVDRFPTSNYHLFQDGRLIRVFILKGKIGGRNIPIEVARELRRASNENRLAVGLEIEPKHVRFSNSFSLRDLDTPVDQLEEIQEVLRTSRRQGREQGLVIEIEWEGEPSPHQLYIHHPERNVWQPVMPQTQSATP